MTLYDGIGLYCALFYRIKLVKDRAELSRPILSATKRNLMNPAFLAYADILVHFI